MLTNKGFSKQMRVRAMIDGKVVNMPTESLIRWSEDVTRSPLPIIFPEEIKVAIKDSSRPTMVTYIKAIGTSIADEAIELTMANNKTLIVAPDMELGVDNGEFENAKNLFTGDHLLQVSGRKVKIEEIKIIPGLYEMACIETTSSTFDVEGFRARFREAAF